MLSPRSTSSNYAPTKASLNETPTVLAQAGTLLARRNQQKGKTVVLAETAAATVSTTILAGSTMSQLHSNLLKLLLSKKQLKLSAIKARRLREALKRLHEEVAGEGHESSSYFGVPLQLQQQGCSSLISSPVPHILETITSYLLDHAGQEGILRKSGNERRAATLKDTLEANNGQVPPGYDYSVHDVTCVLKRWLRSLPEPVVPHVLHEVFAKCVQLESHHHRTQSLLLACLLMPAFHLNTLKHVAVFLQEISKLDTKNKMSSANLAKVVAPSLMPRAAKVETNPEVATRFSERTTTAVQVLIDHAQLIGTLPAELESLRDSGYKMSSEDELSDHGEPVVKRKLFTFLKSKTGGHKAILRGSNTVRNSRRLAATGHQGLVVSTSGAGLCSAKTTGRRLGISNGPPHVSSGEPATSHAFSEQLHGYQQQQQPQTRLPAGSATTSTGAVKSEARITRSASKKRQLSAETVGRIRERRALRTIQSNSRSQPSVRSLPSAVTRGLAATTTTSVPSGRRRSVRRAATCRATLRPGSSANFSAIQRLARPEPRIKSKLNNDENAENTDASESLRPASKVPVDIEGVAHQTDTLQKEEITAPLQESLREAIQELQGVQLRRKAPQSPVDKETARRSFLAAMLGGQEDQVGLEKSQLADKDSCEGLKTFITNTDINLLMETTIGDVSNAGVDDVVDGSEPALDRHGALRKPLMPSNRRAVRREAATKAITATVTVQL